MIFLLKLLRKIIGLLIKLVLLPFRLVLKLVGLRSDSDGGSSAASAAASASAAAAAGAAGAAADRTETEESTAAPTGIDPGTRTNYERFRKALYAYAGLGALVWVFIWAEFNLVGGPQLGPMAVGIAIPAALGYATRTEHPLAWGAGMVYAGLFVFAAFVGVLGLSFGPSFTRAFDELARGGALMIIGLLSLLQIGTLAAALYFGATGRAVALGGGSAPDPSQVGESTTSAAADTGAETDTVTAGTDASEAATAGTATDDPAPGSDGPTGTAMETDSPGTAGASSAGGSTAAATTVSAESSPDTAPSDAPTTGGSAAAADASGTGADASEADPMTETDADIDADSAETGPAVTDLAARARETRDSAAIRDLGEHADGGDIPDEVVGALEACADADDPDARVAVCDACGDIGADETDAILQRLRIDTNDRVATAAMEAY